MANEKRLIDANELLEEIERVYSDYYEKSYEQSIHDLFNAVRRRIRRCHTVDAVEVVHGRWLNAGEFAMCSECTELFKEREVTVFRYCPECGAKMDGDGNG